MPRPPHPTGGAPLVVEHSHGASGNSPHRARRRLARQPLRRGPHRRPYRHPRRLQLQNQPPRRHPPVRRTSSKPPPSCSPAATWMRGSPPTTASASTANTPLIEVLSDLRSQPRRLGLRRSTPSRPTLTPSSPSPSAPHRSNASRNSQQLLGIPTPGTEYRNSFETLPPQVSTGGGIKRSAGRLVAVNLDPKLPPDHPPCPVPASSPARPLSLLPSVVKLSLRGMLLLMEQGQRIELVGRRAAVIVGNQAPHPRDRVADPVQLPGNRNVKPRSLPGTN